MGVGLLPLVQLFFPPLSWPALVLLEICWKFISINNTNKLNDKAIKSHGIGLRCIMVLLLLYWIVQIVFLVVINTDGRTDPVQQGC